MTICCNHEHRKIFWREGQNLQKKDIFKKALSTNTSLKLLEKLFLKNKVKTKKFEETVCYIEFENSH